MVACDALGEFTVAVSDNHMSWTEFPNRYSKFHNSHLYWQLSFLLRPSCWNTKKYTKHLNGWMFHISHDNPFKLLLFFFVRESLADWVHSVLSPIILAKLRSGFSAFQKPLNEQILGFFFPPERRFCRNILTCPVCSRMKWCVFIMRWPMPSKPSNHTESMKASFSRTGRALFCSEFPRFL